MWDYSHQVGASVASLHIILLNLFCDKSEHDFGCNGSAGSAAATKFRDGIRIESPTTLPFFVQDIIPAALPQLLPWESDSVDAKLCLSFLQ